MKKLDCVEMKRKAQRQIRQETRGLSRAEELDYFHRAAESFWHDVETLRKEGASTLRVGAVGKWGQ